MSPRPKRGSGRGLALLAGTFGKPRGRMTPYAFFVQICRQEHKRKHPDDHVVFHEFSKKCADRWKSMTDKEKIRFYQMAEEDKKRYDVEKATYENNLVRKPAPKITTKRKKRKDPNAPKRSMSAFFWFSQDERKKVRAVNPNFGIGEVAKELGRRWAGAETSLRSKYEALAEKDRVRYGKAKKAYQQQLKNPATTKGEGDVDGSESGNE